MNKTYAILASGKLGYTCLLHIVKKHKIEFLFTDKNSIEIIEYAKSVNLPIFIGNPRKNSTVSFLNNKKVDFIISINYLFIIEKDVINFPKYLSINIHGSLLPKYRGRTPHIWSIINNEKICGITAHVLTSECDKGDIIYQETIEILEDYTGNDLLKKYIVTYPFFIEKVINVIESDNFNFFIQDETIATWFSKRSPEDGQISWEWQKERIYNWVRALSEPYPGAFTYYNDEVIIIDKIEYSNLGYIHEIKNGTILDGGFYPVIKTSNGAIKILKTRNNVYFIKGDIFYERH
jgi:methionyl-tRNA formyltransferase